MQQALRSALPKHVKLEQFIRVSLAAMQHTPKLFECSQESILLSMMRAASYGLVPDGGAMGHGYLVPFWNGKAKRMDCQFIPGYRGLVKLARNSGEVADVWAEVVYEADMVAPGAFKYELGLDPTLQHKRNDVAESAGELRYAYAVARFRDGEKRFTVMNRREVLETKAKSASRTREGEVFGPWVDHEAEMWKKTAIRRLCKSLPLSPEVAQQIAEEDTETAIDAFSSVSVSVPSITHESATPIGFSDSVGNPDGSITWREEIAGCETIDDLARVRAAWAKLLIDENEYADMDLFADERLEAIGGEK